MLHCWLVPVYDLVPARESSGHLYANYLIGETMTNALFFANN